MSRNALLEVNAPKKCVAVPVGSSLCKSGSSLDLTELSKQDGDKQTSPGGKLRRVFTMHAWRRSTKKKELVPEFNLSHMMKEPLRVVQSVPLSFPNR
jgi:hypothetical protein